VVVGETAASESKPSSVSARLGISSPFELSVIRDITSMVGGRVGGIWALSGVVAWFGFSSPLKSRVIRDTTSRVAGRVGTGGDTTSSASMVGVEWVGTSSPLPSSVTGSGDDCILFPAGPVYSFTSIIVVVVFRRVDIYTIFVCVRRVALFAVLFSIGWVSTFDIGGAAGAAIHTSVTADWEASGGCEVLKQEYDETTQDYCERGCRWWHRGQYCGFTDQKKEKTSRFPR
jgi:hypothetical protein